ncbi:hypothetical protein CCP2SC5_690001 [Azospirillaceae bacterium]
MVGLQTALDGKQALDATLTALAGATGTGVLTFSAADVVVVVAIGATNATDILNRQAGDGRYLVLSTTSTQDGYFGDVYLKDDTNPSQYLKLTNAQDLSAARTLSISTGDADRTLTITGNATISGTNTGDQTIALTGDVTGSGTGSFTATLANSGVAAGTYNNSATAVTPLTVDAKGRISAVGSSVTITPAWSSITVKPTTLSGYGITDALSSSTTSTQDGYFGDVYLRDDTSSSHYLRVTNAQDLTANRTLSVSTGDADRTLTITGNATISGTNTGDQTIATISGLQTALDGKAPLASPSFTGTASYIGGTYAQRVECIQFRTSDYGTGKPYIFLKPGASAPDWIIGTWDGSASPGNITFQCASISGPTPSVGDNSTKFATTAFTEASISSLQTSLSIVATSGAYSDLSGKPTLGTAAAKDVATSGNASSTQVVKGDDSRLTDARAPTTHSHDASAMNTGTIDIARLPVASSGTSSASHVVRADDNRLGREYLRNAVINGCCRVTHRAMKTLTGAWQYGEVDLFAVRADGSPTAGTIRQTDPAGYNLSPGACSCAVYAATLGTGGAVFWRHRIEARDAARLRNNPATVSLNVFHNVGSTINYTLTINKATAFNDFSSVTQIAIGSPVAVPTSNYVSLSLTASAMGDTTNGLEIIIQADCGAITGRSLYIGDVQLEPGSVKTAFERRPMALETQLVNRFLRTCSGLIGKANSASNIQVPLSHPGMRAAPTYEATAALAFTDAVTTDFTQSQASITQLHENATDGGRVSCGYFSGLTSGSILIQRGTGGVILASAEL